jgi:predicted Zn-dependent protease
VRNRFLRWTGPGLSMIVITGILVTGCVRELSPITGKRQAYGFSWNQEQQIGRETDKEIIQQFGLYEDPAVQEYVQQVGRGVLLKSDLRDKDAPEEYQSSAFTFRVLNSPVVNAFALPGGYVYVTRGLLTHLNNEAQLAVVLGHEIAHVAARHSARQALKAQASQIGVVAAAILGSQVLGSGEAARQVMGLGGGAAQLLLTKYSRDAEREADELGVKYAALRGYDAAEAAAFFDTLRRIGDKEGMRLPSWQSTHPDPGEREVTVTKLAQQYAGPMAIQTVGEDEFLSRIQGMVIGENPREGFVQNGRFYHPDLRFQFPVPSGWTVRNEPAAVMLADPNRRALMTFELAPARTAREAAEKFAQVQGVKVLQSVPTTVNGMAAYTVQASAQTQQGALGLLNYFIERDGRVFSFMGFSAAQQLGNYVPVFQNLVRGFGDVADPGILNVQPARVRIVQVPTSAPFRSFVRDQLPAGLTAEDLAIINQVRLDQQIPAGTKLKLPGGLGLPDMAQDAPVQRRR